MTRKLNTLMLIGLIGTPVAGAQFGVDYSRAVWSDDQNNWWTPVASALPLEKTGGSFQLLLDGEPLQNHLARSSLTALGPEGLAYIVTPDLIKVRLNMRDAVQVPRLHAAIYSAFALGVSLTCLIVGLVRFFRQEPPPRRMSNARMRAPIRR